MAGGAGPLWLMLWGLCCHSWLVVWGPRRCLSVVVCWAFVAISGWWCGALVCHLWCWVLVVFHGWRGWALVTLFVDGGSGPRHTVSGWWWWCALVSFRVLWCMALATLMVVLSLFEGEGGGWSFVLQTLHPSLSCIGIVLSCVVSVCCCRMSLPCHCPLPSSSLSHVIVVAMPLL